jgi:hypothetical protein
VSLNIFVTVYKSNISSIKNTPPFDINKNTPPSPPIKSFIVKEEGGTNTHVLRRGAPFLE